MKHKGPRDYLKIGDHNAFCDVCGFKFKASELRKRWDNMMVCTEDYEVRHPQDFIRGIKERPAPPWSRPRGADVFIVVGPADPTKL
jgi:hypothetical protein